MCLEIRSNVKVQELRDPELYAFLEKFPVKDRSYNMIRLMHLGLLVERGGLPMPQHVPKSESDVLLQPANDIDIEDEGDLFEAGLDEIFGES